MDAERAEKGRRWSLPFPYTFNTLHMRLLTHTEPQHTHLTHPVKTHVTWTPVGPKAHRARARARDRSAEGDRGGTRFVQGPSLHQRAEIGQ